MRVYKSLERRSYVLGLPLTEIGLLLCLFLVGMIGGSLAGMVMKLSWLYYVSVFVLTSGLFFLLRHGAKQNRPSFLLSVISYYVYQPTEICYDEKEKKESD